MRMALVRDGLVENVIEASPDFAPSDGFVAIPSMEAGPGWLHDEMGFHSPSVEAAPAPDEIALWQARAVLDRRGLLAAANAAIAASNDAALKAVWEYGNVISRASAGLAALAGALGLDDSALDTLFVEAAALSV